MVIASTRMARPYSAACDRGGTVGSVHPLQEALAEAADGRFPPVDGIAEVVAPMHDQHAVVEFTGHSFVVTDRSAEGVARRGADGFGGASHPDVLRYLAGPNGWIGSHDAVLVARARGGAPSGLAERDDLADHPRVVRSRGHRRDVRVFGDDTGFVTMGRGLVDRLEMSVELLDLDRIGHGGGRRLIAGALGLLPAGTVIWAQVAPGNAASLRAFLRGGFTPIGGETLIDTRPQRD